MAIDQRAIFSRLFIIFEFIFVIKLVRESITKSIKKVVLKSIAVLRACCSGDAQIVPCQKTHDHICCICKEILLSLHPRLPSIPFHWSWMNKYILFDINRQFDIRSADGSVGKFR